MQILSDTAIGKKGAMMIWRSDTSTTNRIMIQPLDLNGNPTGAPIALEAGNNTSGPGTPAIAWNGALYLGNLGQRNRDRRPAAAAGWHARRCRAFLHHARVRPG